MADWLVPVEVTRGAAMTWVAGVGGRVVAASKDGMVGVRLGKVGVIGVCEDRWMRRRRRVIMMR